MTIPNFLRTCGHHGDWRSGFAWFPRKCRATGWFWLSPCWERRWWVAGGGFAHSQFEYEKKPSPLRDWLLVRLFLFGPLVVLLGQAVYMLSAPDPDPRVLTAIFMSAVALYVVFPIWLISRRSFRRATRDRK